MDTLYILDIGIILFLTKLLGLFSKKIRLPQVVGALVAGIILGPTVLDIVEMNLPLQYLAEIGVMLLMFNAGIETDIFSLKKSIKSAALISLGGMTLSLVFGYFFATYYNFSTMESIFIGVIISATSMSITVETLQELGKIKTKSGASILSASIIDDLLGILLLTVVIAFSLHSTTTAGTSQSSENILIILKVLGNFGMFFLFAYVTGILASKFTKSLDKKKGHSHRIPIFTLAYAFILSYVAEYFGIASITGAYLAGLFFCSSKTGEYVEEKTTTLSYLFFSPIFFASIGLKTDLLQNTNASFIVMVTIFCIIAVLGKMLGAGIGAKLAKYSNRDAMLVGIGMVARGEVSLIIADKGVSVGVISDEIAPAVISVVIFTSLITPILLTKSYNKKSA